LIFMFSKNNTDYLCQYKTRHNECLVQWHVFGRVILYGKKYLYTYFYHTYTHACVFIKKDGS